LAGIGALLAGDLPGTTIGIVGPPNGNTPLPATDREEASGPIRLRNAPQASHKIERRLIVSNEERSDSDLVNPQVNIRILLAVFWICHFILWIFGDMFSLLQEMGEPTTDTAIQFIAPTTVIVLTLVIVFSLAGRPAHVRLTNLIVAPVYLLFNIGFFVDATEGWEYYLGVFYVLFNVLIIWRAYTWPTGGRSETV
jgi:hypothetical protein